MAFELHPQLVKDCHIIGHFPLCTLLLMNDCRYPWFILVPQRSNTSEIYQLQQADQQKLLLESSYLSEQLMYHYQADKMNVAALGNIVPQLHVHHIVRYKTDPAWPAPVWGKLPAQPYSQADFDNHVRALRSLLHEGFIFEVRFVK